MRSVVLEQWHVRRDGRRHVRAEPVRVRGSGGLRGRGPRAECVRLDGRRDLVLLFERGGARKERVILASADEVEAKQPERDHARDTADDTANDGANVTRVRG